MKPYLKANDAHPSRDELVAFLWGHLGGAEVAALARHIEKCDACCQVMREIPDDAFVSRLRGAGLSSGAVEAPIEPTLPPELRDHPRYKLGRFLGAGGMGVVYQAEHRLMDRQVAVKVLHGELIRNPRVLERFRHEVRAAARLNHPNIVTAYDAEQAGDAHFLVVEYIDGMSLARLVEKKGPLEIAYACNFIRQAARGLQHAHEMGMVHRDIKPHNLMLTRKGQVKILDFGLARVASESRMAASESARVHDPGLTRLGELMGTPEFMAPEQITDPHLADIRADLFSLGCTLYFLVTGVPPFTPESAYAALFARQPRCPRPITELRSDVPGDLVALLNRLLANEPADRFQTPAELVKALGAAPKPALNENPGPLPERNGGGEPTIVKVEPGVFLARCPFCTAGVRIPRRALGASIPCPHCNSYFTAVPIESA